MVRRPERTKRAGTCHRRQRSGLGSAWRTSPRRRTSWNHRPKSAAKPTWAHQAELALSALRTPARRRTLAAASALISEFDHYLGGDHADPVADFVGYRQFPLWLSKEEVVELVSVLTPYLRDLAGKEPAPERRPYLFSPTFFALEESAAAPPSATSSEPTATP